MLELWDAYDNQFNKLDNIMLVRGDEIPDGIYHLVCEIAGVGNGLKHTFRNCTRRSEYDFGAFFLFLGTMQE